MKKTFVLLTLIFASVLLVNACSSNDDQDDNSPASGNQTSGGTSTDSIDLSLVDDGVVERTTQMLARAYTSTVGIWPEFMPVDHPAIIVFRNAMEDPIGAIAINYPPSSGLGETTPLDTSAAPFNAVQITTPSAELNARIKALRNFEFRVDIGGISTFMMAAGEEGEFDDPTETDYGQFFMHELFHRYQMSDFDSPSADQSTSTYPFTAANIELALLEEFALDAALQASDQANRDNAARHFVATRMVRRVAEERVRLDDVQETIEGTARYIEHRMAGDDTTVRNHNQSFASNLVLDADGLDGLKGHFGFGRWYATGAAVTELLRRSDAVAFESKIELGSFPADLLAAHLSVDESQADALVASARAAYDSENLLGAMAARAAEKALDESDDIFNSGDEGSGGVSGAEENIQITPEQTQCLIDAGINVEENSVEIPNDVREECFASP